MAHMAGRRKNNSLGLEPRVYMKHGAFYYVHRDGRWEKLGKDIERANARARLYNDSNGLYGTVAYWLDMFVVECENRVRSGAMAQRTLEDYRRDVEPLKVYFAPPMSPREIEPRHVQEYLSIGEAEGRPVRANREKAALSSCMSWLIRSGHVDGLVVNPCLRASGIKRNAETKRDRYVTHAEYQDVYKVAPPQVQAMMELVFRTLQRPESDVLDWTISNIVNKDGRRVLRVKQGKTGKVVDIGLSPELDSLLRRLAGDVPKIGRPLVCTRQGRRYSYDGLSAMLKRSIKKANEERLKAGIERILPFGFRDLKGKGATDMWLAGVPIEEIQMLCGHEDKATTEIYVKQRWRETAAPNSVEIAV